MILYIDHIAQQKNECMGEERFAKWEKVCGNDIYAYFGIMIIMGLVKLSTLHDYWARNPLFHCSVIAAQIDSWKSIVTCILLAMLTYQLLEVMVMIDSAKYVKY